MTWGRHRVLVLRPFDDLPGHYRQHASRLVRELVRCGRRPTCAVIGESRGDLALAMPAGPLNGRYGWRGGALRCLWLLAACLPRILCGRARTIHWTDGVLGVVALCAMLPVGGLRVAFQAWGPLTFGDGSAGRTKRAIVRRLVRRGRLLLLCETTEDAARTGSAIGVRAGVGVLPYPPDWPLAPPRSSARASLGIADDAFVVLLFGVLRHGKAYATVADALDHAPDVRLILAGAVAAVEFAPDLNAICRLEAHPSTVRIGGYLEPMRAAVCFAACDLVLLPYQAASQAGSGVLVDALHFGRPVAVPGGEGRLAREVARLGCGLTYDPSDALWLAALRDRLTGATDVAESTHPADVFASALRRWYPLRSACTPSSGRGRV